MYAMEISRNVVFVNKLLYYTLLDIRTHCWIELAVATIVLRKDILILEMNM
jgi:hypothetical protein